MEDRTVATILGEADMGGDGGAGAGAPRRVAGDGSDRDVAATDRVGHSGDRVERRRGRSGDWAGACAGPSRLAEQDPGLASDLENRKTAEGRQHPDRDAQFNHINRRARAFQRRGDPVVSVDTKKKELVGDFRNGGREWRPAGEPERVRVHDFKDAALGKAVPYGVYDLLADAGWVSVGVDHDTAAFAVETLRRWWRSMGSAAYPRTRRVLVTADAGGSNAARSRLWKAELQRFADETGLKVSVCHFPPGTSKWNKIEHRLFSRIAQNWRPAAGQPRSGGGAAPFERKRHAAHGIANTTTGNGLTVRAELDENECPKGVKVTDEQMAALSLARDKSTATGTTRFRQPEDPTIRDCLFCLES